MKQEKIIDKIKKLMSLASSSNPNEAGLAMAKARELMNEHGITADEIAVSSIKESEAKGGKYKTPPDYVVILAQTVAQLFQCSSFWTTRTETKHSYSRGFYSEYYTYPVFIGIDPHQSICSYTYNYLHRLLVKARKEYGVNFWATKSELTILKDSFAKGWVYGVRSQIEDMVPKTPVTLSEESGVIPVDPFKLYIDSKVQGSMTPRSQDKQSKAAMLRGLEEGEKVQINKGMAKAGQLQIQ